jgi:hypothetical protein
MLLHEWFYDLCSRVCYDREYLYLFFLTHFQTVTQRISQQGKCVATGTYTLPGRKSDLDVMLHWSLSRRLDWTAGNILTVHWQLLNRGNGATCGEGVSHFSLATGEPVPDRAVGDQGRA